MATISQPAVVVGIRGEHGALIQIEDVHKYYDLGETRVHALRGVTLQIDRGEFAAIVGASGSGKSTFMNIVGCLDKPSTGRYLLEGIEVSRLTKRSWRRSAIARLDLCFKDSICFRAQPRWRMLSYPRCTRTSVRKKDTSGRMRLWNWWDSAIAPSTSLPSFRAGSSSGWRLREPW